MYMHIYASNCSEDSFVSDLNEFMNLTPKVGRMGYLEVEEI